MFSDCKGVRYLYVFGQYQPFVYNIRYFVFVMCNIYQGFILVTKIFYQFFYTFFVRDIKSMKRFIQNE